VVVLLEEHPLQHLRPLVPILRQVLGALGEVDEDRVRLGQRPAVVEHERRHAKRRIEATEKLRAPRPVGDVDRLALVRETKMREEQAHLEAVARDGTVVQQHDPSLAMW
jgi:hypothetical protein